jgi:hypothetical protein
MKNKIYRKIFKMNESKIIRINILFLTVLLGFALIPGLAYTNAPEDIQLSYDETAQSIKVSITHPSTSPDKHYITKVQIIKNRAVVQTADYNSQPNRDTFSYDYRVPVSPRDVVEVKVTCNVSGTKTKKLTASVPSRELR